MINVSSKIRDSRLHNPFVGLRAFEENEDYLFFGRGQQIDELLKKLSESRFLTVIGSSGSGKSSLVKSGLLPAIFSGSLKVGSNWRVALIRPGENPIGFLTKELANEGVLYNDTDKTKIPLAPIIESTLRRSENGLTQVYKDARLPANENLLIVIDQFEELFRFSKYEKDNKLGKSDAIHFIQILLTAAQQTECPGIYVLLTMRSDFLGDCSQFIGLPEAINRGQYLVPRMTREDIREAITGPVAVSGATISQQLITRLLNDINNDTDQLPILQHSMMRTWEAWYNRNQRNSPIDFVDYDKIGTIKTALSNHANEAFEELKAKREQDICEAMFKALTDKTADVRGIRRPRSINHLCLITSASEKEVIHVVELFRKPGRTFLMPPPGEILTENSIIDISHESLMRVWDKLKTWAGNEAQSGEVYLRLARDARDWEKGDRGLMQNPELGISLKWKENNKPTAEWAKGYKGDFELALKYLEESRKKALAKRRLKLGLLGLFILSLIALASWTSYKKIEADNLRMVADSLKIKADSAAIYAIDQAKKAKIAEINAQKSDSLTKIALRIAYINDSIARAERDTARQRTKETIAAKEKADSLSRTSAVGEYQRLIREMPEDKDSILNKKFQYKVVAYCEHLGILKDSFKIEKSEKKNSELYDKLYFSLKALKFQEQAITKSDNNKVNRSIALKQIEDANDGLKIIPAKNNILIIQSTSANQKTDSIFMGKEVTAMAYLGKANLLVFGMVNGEIGFIKYVENKKKQSVIHRKNDLLSRITSVGFFKHDRKDYLLVTSYLGQAVIFEQDVIFGIDTSQTKTRLSDNIKLPVIELPEYYGQIENANYDTAIGKVRLLTSKGTYLWNPFADELLDKLKSKLDVVELSKWKNNTRIYK